MKTHNSNNVKQPFYKAMLHAFDGIKQFFKTERNGKIQLVISVIVVFAGLILRINDAEWIEILLCIIAVFSLEMMNSAIEDVCNLICTDHNPVIKRIKDIAADAVLTACLLSIAIASFIFLPKLFKIL